MRYSVAATLLLLSLISAFQVVAQEQLAGLKRGQKVRVYAPSIYSERFIGEVGQLTDEYLEILPSVQPDVRRRIAFAEVERLEISRGRWAVPLGLVIGWMAGAVASIPVAKQCGDSPLGSGGKCAFMTVLLFGSAGGALGAGVGGLMAGDSWRQISLDQLRVQPLATLDAFAVAASVRF